MEKIYREAFAEVLEVLNNSNQNIIEKIPQKLFDFLNKNKDNNYIVNIDFYNEKWEDYTKKETQAILALIYRDYIVSKEERIKLLEQEKQEQIRIEKELREKYNPNNVFKKHNLEEDTIKEEQALVEYKESIFKRFINKIKNIFNIK